MIDREQASVGGRRRRLAVTRQTEEFHAVVMIAGAVVEIGIGAVVLVSGCRCGQWIAQCIQHAGGIASRHDDGIGQAFRHCAEREQLFRGTASCRWRHYRAAAAACGQAKRAKHCTGSRGGAAAQQVAAADTRMQNSVEMLVRRFVRIDVVVIDHGAAKVGWFVHVRVLSTGEKWAR